MFDFDKIPAAYWSEKEKLSFLQRRILVYSLAYYELDENIVSDFFYESVVKQYLELAKKNKNLIRRTTYHRVFVSFEGSTGIGLLEKLNENEKAHLMVIVKNVLNCRGV